MAERKGIGGDRAGHGDVESSQQEDRSRGTDDVHRNPADVGSSGDDVPADRTELTDHRPDSGSAESQTGESDAVPSNRGMPQREALSEGAEVIAFRRSHSDADGEAGIAATDLVDLEDLDDEPVNLSDLQADDALLDALGGTNPAVSGSGSDNVPGLEALLLAWRQDVDAAPIGELVDIDTAVATIADARRPRRNLKRRHLIPVASAAAVLMIAFAGVGLAARDALPGDMLWGVAQVLYTDHVRAVQAAASVREDLRTAEGALDQGDRVAAEGALHRADQQMPKIDDENGLASLRAAHASLSARIDRLKDSESQRQSAPRSSTSDYWREPTASQPPSPAPVIPPPPSTSTPPTSQPPTSVPPSESSSPPSETSGSAERSTTSTTSTHTGLLPG